MEEEGRKRGRGSSEERPIGGGGTDGADGVKMGIGEMGISRAVLVLGDGMMGMTPLSPCVADRAGCKSCLVPAPGMK